MGFFKHLLFWPVTGPLFLTRFSLDKVRDSVREELTDEDRVREDLLALQMELELGEIDEEEYTRREAELMEELREVREWRRRFGMGVRGGPVRVAREARREQDPADREAGSDGDPSGEAPGEDHPSHESPPGGEGETDER